jgi:L-seryl-tRNA(Ser) seleniumtransferase
MAANPFRELPSVSELCDAISASGTALSGDALVTHAQQLIAIARSEIERGTAISRAEITAGAVANALEMERSKLEPVINATGVIIHTNLGRAPVSSSTAHAMSSAASAYVPLEIDPESNERGGRMAEISALMRLLTGAEVTLVVNNNAAAVLLVLSAIAAGKSVIVSRGEAVEIGGGFRIPDVLRQSGAKLVEVGTTNRTYLRDYESAIDGDTAAFLKVHASNFTIDGFTATTNIEELAALSATTAIPVIEDLGSGALLDTRRFGLAGEPTIGQRLADGASLVTASGDKLLGGPQAGIIAGRRELVGRIERHPLARAVRADKTTLAGVAATLRHYVSGTAERKIPIWRMIGADIESIRRRARRLAAQLADRGVEVEMIETEATIGGGSLPGQTLPSIALSVTRTGQSLDDLATALRMGSPRVFGRIESGRLLLDLRAVLPELDDDLARAVVVAISA